MSAPPPLIEVKRLFIAVRDIPADEQDEWLIRQCAGNAPLLHAVRELMRHAEEGTRELATDAPRLELDEPLTLEPPPELSDFRIIRRIGAGGMGVVYEAEQHYPQRRVAIKTLRHPRVSADRFRREIASLSRLQHPGIVQLFGAGELADGAPWFAMEYVEAVTLARLDRSTRTIRERLELVCRICDAIQHAHDQGVIHRDLKPDNILVIHDTGGDHPKILDFGIARLADDPRRSLHTHTLAGQLLGTLPYMSPEQTETPNSLDHRADVYALGVILYELLADQLPLSLDLLPIDAALRAIRFETPTRLSSHDPRLRGDLDVITRRAMEKDPARRYQSAAELAADIRRYLRNQPIEARPTSAIYALRKFARRHRPLVAAISAVMLTLALGAVVAILFAVEARRNHRIADRNAALAQLESYRSRIAAIANSLDLLDGAAAAELLAEIPASQRAWEARYLAARIDQRSGTSTEPIPWRPGAIPPGAEILDFDSGADRVAWRDPEHTDTITILDADANVRHVVDLSPLGARFDVQLHRVLLDAHALIVLTPQAVHVLDLSSLDRLASVELEAPVRARAALSVDRRYLAVSSTHLPLRIHDLHTDDQFTLDPTPGALHAICFSPTGDALFSGDPLGRIIRWDVATGRQTHAGWEHRGHTLALTAHAAADRTMLASTARDGVIRLWDADTLTPIGAWLGQQSPASRLAFSPDGRLLYSREAGGVWNQWTVADASDPPFAHHESFVYDALATRDGAVIFSGGWDGFEGHPGALRAWDVRTAALLWTLGAPGDRVVGLALTPDQRHLVASFWRPSGSEILLIDAVDGEILSTIPLGALDNAQFALSPDGEQFVVGPTRAIWNVRSSAPIHTLAPDLGPGSHARPAWSPDGHTIAGWEQRDTLAFWSTERHALRQRATLRDSPRAMAFDPTSSMLAVTTASGSLVIIDVDSGDTIATVSIDPEEAFSVAWHPTEHRIAAAGRRGIIHIIDTRTWSTLLRLRGHDSYVFSLQFTADGDTLISASGDHTLRRWTTRPSAAPVAP